MSHFFAASASIAKNKLGEEHIIVLGDIRERFMDFIYKFEYKVNDNDVTYN